MTTHPSIAIPAHQWGRYFAPTAAHSAAINGAPTRPLTLKTLIEDAARESGGNLGPAAHDALAQADERLGVAGHATNQALKIALARAKLMAVLVCAGLRSAHPLDAYVERATAWLAGAGRELVALWQARAGLAPDPDRLSGYHRYEVCRLLADRVAQNPELPFERTPAEVAHGFADLPPQPQGQPSWHSAGAALDVALGEGHALARVVEAVSRCPFERSLDTVLGDARRVLAEQAPQRTTRIGERCADQGWEPFGEQERDMVYRHALHVGGRIYAAALERVYGTSVALMADVQHALNAGQHEYAEALAEAYQAAGLGLYRRQAGLPG